MKETILLDSESTPSKPGFQFQWTCSAPVRITCFTLRILNCDSLGPILWKELLPIIQWSMDDKYPIECLSGDAIFTLFRRLRTRFSHDPQHHILTLDLPFGFHPVVGGHGILCLPGSRLCVTCPTQKFFAVQLLIQQENFQHPGPVLQTLLFPSEPESTGAVRLICSRATGVSTCTHMVLSTLKEIGIRIHENTQCQFIQLIHAETGHCVKLAWQPVDHLVTDTMWIENLSQFQSAKEILIQSEPKPNCIAEVTGIWQ